MQRPFAGPLLARLQAENLLVEAARRRDVFHAQHDVIERTNPHGLLLRRRRRAIAQSPAQGHSRGPAAAPARREGELAVGSVALKKGELPEFGEATGMATVPPATYEARIAAIVDRGMAAGLDGFAVYGDREHAANVAY